MFAKSSTPASFDVDDFDTPENTSPSLKRCCRKGVEHFETPEKGRGSDRLAGLKTTIIWILRKVREPATSKQRPEKVLAASRNGAPANRVGYAGDRDPSVSLLFPAATPRRRPAQYSSCRNADIRTEIDGMIAEVRVTEGAIVHKGDVIALLSTRENLSELDRKRTASFTVACQVKTPGSGPHAR